MSRIRLCLVAGRGVSAVMIPLRIPVAHGAEKRYLADVVEQVRAGDRAASGVFGVVRCERRVVPDGCGDGLVLWDRSLGCVVSVDEVLAMLHPDVAMDMARAGVGGVTLAGGVPVVARDADFATWVGRVYSDLYCVYEVAWEERVLAGPVFVSSQAAWEWVREAGDPLLRVVEFGELSSQVAGLVDVLGRLDVDASQLLFRRAAQR